MRMRTKRLICVGVLTAVTVLMIILLIHPIKMTSQASSLTSLNETTKLKEIYVIYDNSTSMIRDDGNPQKYTTRWVEASYAIKALATMMSDGDVLRIYPISGGDKSKEIKVKEESLDNVLREIENGINSLKWQTGTNFRSVENAVNDIRNNYDDEYEHWIVILTDGAFGDLQNVPLQDKLENINSSIMKEKKPIYLAYIHISGGTEREGDDVIENRPYIFVPDSENEEITSKMTNIANKIYNRVAIKSPEDYIGTEGNNTQIKLNIPLERALVFIQHTGEEKNYELIKDEIATTYRNMNPDVEIECSAGLKEYKMYPITGDSRIITDDSFDARPGDGTDISQIKYRFIQGNMHVITTVDSKIDFREQYITVRGYTKDSADSSIDVYYKPSVDVEASYYQNGQEVFHTQECIDGQNQNQTERCIPAGELIIQVDIFSNDPKKKLPDYELLYPDDFEVSLCHKSDNNQEDEWEEVVVDRISCENLQYRCELEQGEYELKIITSWNTTYVQELEIQERWQHVGMEFYDTDCIYLESVENPSCEVQIRAFSESDASDETVLGHVRDIRLETDNELFDVEKVERQGNNIWKFRVTLKDPSIHDVGERLALWAVAETDYQSTQSNEHKFQGDLPITSSDFTLSAESPAEANDYFRRLFQGETVRIEYICDGIELTEEQQKGIHVFGDYTVEPEKMRKKLRITNNGNIRLEYSPLYWFFHRDDMVILKWNITYTRWNTEKSQEVVMELNISYLSLIAQWMIILTTLLLFIWIVLCIAKRFTRDFIHREQIMLVSNFSNQKIRLCRKGMLWIPFWKKARIKYRDSSGYFPEIQLDIRKNPEGAGYEILNYDMLGDETRYRLGSRRISENNRIISDAKRVQIADRNEVWYRMVIKR